MTDAFDESFRAIENGDEIVAPGLVALYEYWQNRRGTNRFAPTGHDYMLEFPTEAALWTICDVRDGGDDFFYRFAGSDLVSLIGVDPTAQCLNTLIETQPPSQFGVNTRKIFKLVLETGLPVLNGPRRITIEDKSYLCLQTLNLPLGEDGAGPEQILGAIELIRAPHDHGPE